MLKLTRVLPVLNADYPFSVGRKRSVWIGFVAQLPRWERSVTYLQIRRKEETERKSIWPTLRPRIVQRHSFSLEISLAKLRFYCLILYFTAEREKREREERARREKEQKEKEEKEKKEKEEEEKAEKERQEKLQKEAEEREKRKQRLEEIMRRRRTDSSTSDQKVY